MLERVWGRGTPHSLLVGLKPGSATLEISSLWRIFNLPYCADILLLGRHPEKPTSYLTDPCSARSWLITALSQTRKWTQLTRPSSVERIMKMCCRRTMGCCSAIEESGITNFAGKWMETENIILIKTQKDKHHMFSLTWGSKTQIFRYEYVSWSNYTSRVKKGELGRKKVRDRGEIAGYKWSDKKNWKNWEH